MGGLASISGGVLFAVWGFVHRDGAPVYFTVIASTLAFVVPLLFVSGLVGLCGRRAARVGRLGGIGFVLAFVGCVRGAIDGVATDPAGYLHSVGYGWAAPLLEWLSLLSVGLTLVGIAALVTRAGSRGWGLLPLTIGFCGWAYILTDYGNLLEARPAHILSGLLFSAGWVALGLLLWSAYKTPTSGAV